MESDSINKAIHQQLNWRYATKRFDPTKKISEEHLQTLKESLRLAPSSFGLEPWRFIVVEDPTVRQKLRAHSWNQSQITDSSHLIILTAKTSITQSDIETFLERIARTRGIPTSSLQEYGGMMQGFISHLNSRDAVQSWTGQQVYLALGMLLMTAAMLSIDACPMEGIDPVQYDAVLGLTGTEYSTRVACTLGYRSNEDTSAGQRKVRLPEEVVFLKPVGQGS
jgi:nitroreductase